ncbi:putative deoxyribonuclease TATDN2 [Haliotis rubra]|uniref:putative deoxyribonuclease TATDN2 n=1 Tax=Haliotis rubra TaxID=36100 RepID=UPI001EE5850D|nr:putative deoxyribonuclease TATDN2 [Haliotis rubra]
MTVLKASHEIPRAEFQRYSGCLGALCSAAGWSQINNSDIPCGAGPAALLHPRWLALVINYLSPARRDLVADLFRERLAVADYVPSADGVERLPPGEDPGQQIDAERLPSDAMETTETMFVVHLPSPIPPADEDLPEAFDSHFHADRTCRRLFGDTTVESPLDTLVDWTPVQAPSYPVKLVGGVTCFCDPEVWPASLPTRPSWKVSLGIHPRKIAEASPGFVSQFIRQCAEPGVSAIGEIGYDLMDGRQHLAKQHQLLETILGSTREGLPLIFHVRGAQGDDLAEDLYSKLRELVGQFRSPEQTTVLHCFHGNLKTVRSWLEAFPNTFFSVNGFCRRVKASQQEALLAIPKDNLLLETDSPYLGVTNNVRCNLPHYIGDVAQKLAGHFHMSPRELIEVCTANGRRVFLK